MATTDRPNGGPPPHPRETAEAFAPAIFWMALAGLCLVGSIWRVAILREFLRVSPVAEHPTMDAAVYWQQADRMAHGQWVDSTPLVTAPLYPYLLGVVRAFGGGLHVVYILQLAMHVLTAALIGLVAKIRFGCWAGLLAAALFLALTEPAYSITRILANTLQLLLITLLWWRWAMLIETGIQWRKIISVSVILGVFALAFPAALLLVPAFGLWLCCHAGYSRLGFLRGLVAVAAALVVVSPATIYNSLLQGEFIPISAHGGITLRQGNGPNAIGLPATIPGVSRVPAAIPTDASKVFEKVYGRCGTWREIDAHFRREAIKYLLEDPVRALRLFGHKLYFYLTFQHYDEGMLPITLERKYGFADRAILAPLAMPWILGPAFMGAVACLRRPAARFPEWVLFMLPLVVVLVFFYIPRYRLVGAPLFCGLAAFALTHFWRWRCPRTLSLAAFLLPLVLIQVNAAHAIDRADAQRELFLRTLPVPVERPAGAAKPRRPPKNEPHEDQNATRRAE